MELKLFSATSSRAQAVWLLDDDPSGLKSLGRLLDSSGWNVKSFTDPFAFLQQAGIDCPDVVVIDIMMPKMNGLEVQKRLQVASPSTRVVVLTSRDEPSIRQTAMAEGASAFFIKGVDNKEFLEGIKTAAASSN